MDKIISNHAFAPLHTISLQISDTDASVLPIDQCYSTPNNINPATGFPYTDIQIVMRAKSLSERNRLMSDLQVMKSDFIDSNVSDDEAVKMVSSRTSQLASELLDEAKEHVKEKVAKHNSKVEAAQQQKIYDDFVERTTPKSNLNTD